MRIGVICEGPTDYPAVSLFMGSALRSAGVNPTFVSLFPKMDRTRPEGGWASVLLWLNNNLPESRVARYFGGGLFGGALSSDPLDAIVIQLDADVIGDEFFRMFVNKHYDYQVNQCDEPADRAAQIRNVLSLAAKLEAMAEVDRAKHVLTPAVEATETWCVAAFHAKRSDFERLRGEALANAFMTVLERSEGRDPRDNYAHIDKNLGRRQRFCEKHSAGVSRVASACAPFAEALDSLRKIAAPPLI